MVISKVSAGTSERDPVNGEKLVQESQGNGEY